MNPFYDRKLLVWALLGLCGFLFLCKVTAGIAFALIIIYLLAAIASGKRENLFLAVFFTTAAMVIGGYFMPKSIVMVVSQKVALLLMALFLVGDVLARKHPPTLTPVLSIVPYLVFIAIVSQVGWAPMISNLKMLLFCMVFLALYGMAVRITSSPGDARQIRTFFLAMAIVFVFGSLLVKPFPVISVMGADDFTGRVSDEFVSLFKGITPHSQVLGPVVGMISTMLFADLMFTLQRKDWLYYLLLACCPILIYWTSSRTAMAGYLAGMGYVSYFALKARGIKRIWKAKLIGVISLIVIGGVVAVLALPSVRLRMTRFVVKSYSGETAMEKELILGSRQGKFDFALENWRRSPWVGNGFQVTEEMEYWRINSIKDMLSAPVEKSTWMYAVLEEGGIIGLILFCLFFVIAIGLMTVRRAYIGAAMLFQFIIVNMGEFGIFSMSAEGGMFWCMVFTGLIFDHARLYAETRRMMPPMPICYQR